MTTATPDTYVAQLEKELAPQAAITAISIILSKGSLDMVYPALILANGARMSGIDATIFFTFWGLDAITEKKLDHLHVATVGNPSFPMPTMVGGLPGLEAMATGMMKKKIEQLDIPPVREMLDILRDSGAKLYACRMAMEMFELKESDLHGIDGVLSVMDFFDKAAGSQILFI